MGKGKRLAAGIHADKRGSTSSNSCSLPVYVLTVKSEQVVLQDYVVVDDRIQDVKVDNLMVVARDHQINWRSPVYNISQDTFI